MTSPNHFRFKHLQWIFPLLLCIFLVAVWSVLVARKVLQPTIVPSPSQTILAALEFRDTLAADFLATLWEVILGFLITVGLAMVAAIALHVLPRLSQAMYGLLLVLQSVPLFAVAPVLFSVFGSGLGIRLIVIILVAFFPVLVNTAEGLRRIDPELLDLFGSMNATTWQKLMLLEIPSALAMVFAGSKITLTMCVIGAVLAEMLVGDMTGLGYRIKSANAFFRADLVFACIALLSLMSVVLYALLTLSERRFQPWTSREEGR
jgi:NitT/TauT family transport system permease protein